MKTKPIIFSGPMIKALLDGRKMQTRRVLDNPCDDPPALVRDGVIASFDENEKPYRWPRTHAVGEMLWCRETMRVGRETLIFNADGNAVQKGSFAWQEWGYQYGQRHIPSIHMPRWASRLTLEVTDVCAERIQEISEADAIAEGVEPQDGDGFGPGAGLKWEGTGYHAGTMSAMGKCYHTPFNDGRSGCSCKQAGPSPAQCAFRELWDRIHGDGAWQRNDWVAAYTFTVHHRNIDDLLVEREVAA